TPAPTPAATGGRTPRAPPDSRTARRPASRWRARAPAIGTTSPCDRTREILPCRGDEQRHTALQRILVHVEALMMVRIANAARLVPCANEEERPRRALLERGEILAAHAGTRLHERVRTQRARHDAAQQLRDLVIVHHRPVATVERELVRRAVRARNAGDDPLHEPRDPVAQRR